MPYKRVSDLPKEIRKKYPSAKEQRAFLKAFNSTYDDCGKKGKSAEVCEGQAFGSGHTAAQGVKQMLDEQGNIEAYTDPRYDQQDAGYDPTGGTSEAACANCRWFNAPMGCHLVKGAISPTGISDFFAPLTPPDEDDLLEDFLDEEEIYDEKSLWIDSVKEAVKNAVTSLLGMNKEDDDFFDTPTGFKMLSDNRWVAWYTNAYEDRDKEYFPTAAIEADTSRMFEEGEYPELWHWHIPGTKHGKADWAGMIGRFAVATGTFDNTPAARKFKQHYRKNEVRLSHGFTYDPDEYKDGAYHVYKTFEISTLPPGREANPFTNFAFKQGESHMATLNKEQVLSLIRVVGEDEARKMIEQGKANTKEADKVAAFKAAQPTDDEPTEEKASDYKALEARLSKMEAALEKMMQAAEKKEDKQAEIPAAPPLDDRLTEILTHMKAMQEKQEALEGHVKSVQGANFDSVMQDWAKHQQDPAQTTEPALAQMFKAMGFPTEGENK